MSEAIPTRRERRMVHRLAAAVAVCWLAGVAALASAQETGPPDVLCWTGRVVDEAGEPIADALVQAWGGPGPYVASFAVPAPTAPAPELPTDGLPREADVPWASVRTADDGAFALQVAVRHRTEPERVVVRSTGRRPRALPFMRVAASTRHVGDVALERAGEDAAPPVAPFPEPDDDGVDPDTVDALWFTRADSPLADLMVETTWSDPRVIARRGEGVDVLRVDVTADPELVARLGLDLLPTLVVRRGGIESERRAGFLAPSLVERMLTTRTARDEDLRRELADPFLGEWTRVSLLDLMAMRADRMPPEQTVEAALELWRRHDRRLAGYWHGLSFAHALTRLVDELPEAAAPFDELFHERVADISARRADACGWLDAWALAHGLEKQAALGYSLGWIVLRMGRDVVPPEARTEYQWLVSDLDLAVEAGLLESDDVVASWEDFGRAPDAEELRRLEAFHAAMVKKLGPLDEFLATMREARRPESRRSDLLVVVTRLAAAARDDDVRGLARILLRVLDDAESRLGLVEAVHRADLRAAATRERLGLPPDPAPASVRRLTYEILDWLSWVLTYGDATERAAAAEWRRRLFE